MPGRFYTREEACANIHSKLASKDAREIPAILKLLHITVRHFYFPFGFLLKKQERFHQNVQNQAPSESCVCNIFQGNVAFVNGYVAPNLQWLNQMYKTALHIPSNIPASEEKDLPIVSTGCRLWRRNQLQAALPASEDVSCFQVKLLSLEILGTKLQQQKRKCCFFAVLTSGVRTGTGVDQGLPVLRRLRRQVFRR